MSIEGLSFNQSCDFLACGTKSGYMLYGLKPEFNKKLYDVSQGGVKIIKIRNCSNIFAVVGGSDKPICKKNEVGIWDEKRKRMELVLKPGQLVKNVCFVNDYIAIVLEKRVELYNMEGKRKSEKNTFFNSKGICVMNVVSENPKIITLGFKIGEIAYWGPRQDEYFTIKAHKNNIAVIATSWDGRYVATASECGANIHVYDLKNSDDVSKPIHKFKRGSFSKTIHDLAFSKDVRYLACCVDGGTIHIYHIPNEGQESKNQKSIISFDCMRGIFPETIYQEKSFREHYIEDKGKIICKFDSDGDLHVATFDGMYYKIGGENYDNRVGIPMATETPGNAESIY